MTKLRHEIFYEEVKSLIKDFTKKKKEYSRCYQAIKFLIIFSMALSTLFMGLTFIEDISFACKITAIVFSTLSTIFIGWEKTMDYKKLWQQRTNTLIALQQLKRKYKSKIMPYVSVQNPMDTELDELFEDLKEIMNADVKKWDSNIDGFGNI